MKFKSIFTIILFFSTSSKSQNLDLRLYDDVHGNRNRSLDGAMNAVSFSTYPIALALPLGQLIHSFSKHDERSIENVLQTTTAFIVAATLTYGLKYTVQRDRPYISHPQYTPYEYDDSPTFPSGHVSFAFATATSLSVQYKKWYVVAPAFLYAGVVGYSRVHLGAHYPSDVLAGSLVGAGSSLISYKANQWLKKKWKRKTEEKFSFAY